MINKQSFLSHLIDAILSSEDPDITNEKDFFVESLMRLKKQTEEDANQSEAE